MDTAVSGLSFRFGRFSLWPGQRQLLLDDRPVALSPRALDVLLVLVEHAGQLVNKDTLLDAVWHGLVVEEANLHVQVSQLRKVIGAEAITTVAGRGYRFVAPLEGAPAAKRRLSLLVLPFIASGAPPENEDFADAITDDLSVELARMRGSFVVAGQAALRYKREPFDPRAEAQALGVRYILQGRVDRRSAGVETNSRLIDASTGALVWGESFVLASGPGTRRAIVARVLEAVKLALIQVEAARTRTAGEGAPEADDLLLQAGAIARTARAPQDLLAALALIDRARALAPDRTSLRAYRARVLTTLVSVWPQDDAAAHIEEAERDISAALAADASDAHAHCTLSRVRQLQLRIAAALTAVDQALDIDGGFAEALCWRGALKVYNGEVQAGIESVSQALAIAPHDPHRWGAYFWLGKAHLLSGCYEEAVPWLEKCAALVRFWPAQAYLAAANAHLERGDELKVALAALREEGDLVERSRGMRLSSHPTYLQLRHQHYTAGLVKAGVLPAPAACA